MNSQEIINKETKEESAYFLILIPSEEVIIDIKSINFISEISPKIIYIKNIEKENGTFLQEIVFKFKKEKKVTNENESNKYIVKFFKDNYMYNISFSIKDNYFVYSPELSKGNKYLENPTGELIEQNNVPLYNKLYIFLEALEKNDENNKKEILYEDSINLYKKKKNFNLLIILFLLNYEKNKDLCNKLMEIFYQDNEIDNNDRDKHLEIYLSDFKDIYSNADKILEENKYNPIYFYGILFCYLNYYDKNNFIKIIKEFSEGNSEILYVILIQYYSHFKNPFYRNKEFYECFIKYALNKRIELKIFKRILNYIDDIETFLFVINSNLMEICEIYEKLESAPIKISDGLKLMKYRINKREIVEKKSSSEKDSGSSDEGELDEIYPIKTSCKTIINLINEIIEFSRKKQILVVYLPSSFWINLFKEYNIPDRENIYICHKVRELYKRYNNFINYLSIKYDQKNEYIYLKNDINKNYERDEFAFMLNKNIKEFIEKNKNKLTNSEILGTISQYNPYFSICDKDDREKYKNNRETYIFDYINFNKTTTVFINNFQNFNFEFMFEENITDYINKITSKITNIQTFGNIIKLIKIERLNEEKQKYYFRILEQKYKLIIKNDIKFINNDNELNKSIKIIAEFVSKIYLFEKNNRFLNDEIEQLKDKIKLLIYIELITTYNKEEYNALKNRIYDLYLDKIQTKEGRENMIKLVQKLDDDDEKSYFIYEKLLEKCNFTKEEFFSNHENYKIKTLCLLIKELNKWNKSEKVNKYSENFLYTLNNIIHDLDIGIITKKELEKFLNIKREKYFKKILSETAEEENESDKYVKDKLLLIARIIPKYDPIEIFKEYKCTLDKINETIEKLKFIKDSLMIFHGNFYREDIKKIKIILNEIGDAPIHKFYTDKTRSSIETLLNFLPLCDEINKVKNFLLFKKIFINTRGRDQRERFEDSIRKLKDLKKLFKENSADIEVILNDKNYVNIFKDIKEEMAEKSEIISKEFIYQMINYFDIEDKNVIKDLKILINSKKYEMILKSMKYFFDCFLNKKLALPDNINISEMNLKDIKIILNELKRQDIYESYDRCYKVFTSFYEKRESIDFLISKINNDIIQFEYELKGKLDLNNNIISIKDIDDMIECLKHFKSFIDLDAYKIIKYIELLDEESIKKFENFTRKSSFIIELDNVKGEDIFNEVYNIIQASSFLINIDNEDLTYMNDNKTIKISNIEYLIKLKNKIQIQPKKIIKENEDKNIVEIKCDKLIFYKKIICGLEEIYNIIIILREKGCNIPLDININIKYPEVSYKLYDVSKSYNDVKNYLFCLKNDYENQLDIIYKNESYLRFLYGKLFRIIKIYKSGFCEASDILRYILNKIDYNERIKDSDIYIGSFIEDYYKEYKDYTNDIFQNISKYMISLFLENDLNFQKHYENMLIKTKQKYNGIYIHKCEKESMEEYILCLFLIELDKLPIAQNILVCNSETSIEEIQSFLHRAIFCEYNTLFIIELLESLSWLQYNKMYRYIDELLSYKLEKKEKIIKMII